MYIDFEYYSSRFPFVDEDNFKKLLPQAEARLDTVTHMRAKEFVDTYDSDNATFFEVFTHTKIKDCVCNLINAIYSAEKAQSGKGITSVSNDGYSENYENTTVLQAEQNLKSVVYQWLSGTGMVGVI
jgi:hypothetical protein